RKKVPIPGLALVNGFMDCYEAAMAQAAPVVIGAKRTKPGTVNEAVARYLGSAAFTQQLAPSSQAMRRRILERLRVEHGDKRLRKLEAQHVARLLGKLRPWVQRNCFKTLRGLIAFALTERLIEIDPTAGVKLAKVKDTGGVKKRSLERIEQYRTTHKIGTRTPP